MSILNAACARNECCATQDRTVLPWYASAALACSFAWGDLQDEILAFGLCTACIACIRECRTRSGEGGTLRPHGANGQGGADRNVMDTSMPRNSRLFESWLRSSRARTWATSTTTATAY